jgi:hypothetical protein
VAIPWYPQPKESYCPCCGEYRRGVSTLPLWQRAMIQERIDRFKRLLAEELAKAEALRPDEV